jgi:hypothetical protein
LFLFFLKFLSWLDNLFFVINERGIKPLLFYALSATAAKHIRSKLTFNIVGKTTAFVDEYLIDLNATQSAIRAGYKPEWAGTNADKLLKNTKIQEYLSERQKARSERTEITQDMVLRELANN